MRSSGKRSNSPLRLFIPVIAVFCAVSLVAQKEPRYDVQTESKLKGSVEEVRLPPTAKGIVHLLVKAGGATVDVYLGPKAFLDDMGMAFSKGDEISLTGSKVKEGDADVILAREVVRGTDTFVFRDDKGKPVWG